MKPIKQFLSLIVAVALCFALGGFAASAAGSPSLAVPIAGGLILRDMVNKGEREHSLFMATPDTSALSAHAGKYERALFFTLRQKLSIFNDITVIPGIKNWLKLTKLTVKDGVRGYREDFDSSDDDLSYSGRDLDVELLKRDIKINPLKYRSTWMSEAMRPGVNPDDIPFASFVNSAIMEQIAQEVNKGSYLAVKGDLSTLAKSFDGLGTIVSKAITAETTTPGYWFGSCSYRCNYQY